MRFQVRQAKDGKGKTIPGKQRIKYFGDAGEYLGQETIQGDKNMARTRGRNKLAEMEQERHRAAVGLSTPKTDIRAALADYMKDKIGSGGKGGGKWSESAKYRARIRLGHWLDAMPWKNVQDITRKDVALHLADLRAKGLADSTYESFKIYIRAFTKWCTDMDLLPKDPLRGMKVGRIQLKEKRRGLTAEELVSVFEHCTEDDYFILKGGAVSGLRVRELDAVRMDWMDWDRGVMLPAWRDKVKVARLVEMPSDYLAELKAYCAGRGPKDRVFRPFSPSNASRMLAKYCRAAGVPLVTAKGKVVFHSLRYSFVSILNSLNPDLKTRLDLSRHADVSTNLGYTDEEILARRAAIEAISRKLRGHLGGTLDSWMPGTLENIGRNEDRSGSGISVSSSKSPVGQSESLNTPENRHLHLGGGTPVSQGGRKGRSQGPSHGKLARQMQEIWPLLNDADRQSAVNHVRGLLLGLKVHKRGVA